MDDADSDPINELQDLEFNNHVLRLNLIGTPTNVNLSPYINTDNQTLTFDQVTGQVSISNGNSVTMATSGGDGWGSDVVAVNSTLSGDGSALNPLGIAQNGATNGQVLQWDGTNWVPSTPVDLVDDADADVTNEIQTISKDPTTGEISLSMGGGTVSDNVDDADANPTNEIQTLSKDPATGDISLTNGGTVADNVDDADADPSNETITGWNTNATTLQINEAGVSHNIGMTPFIDDADASLTNELQTLSINGNIISISNGNSIAVPTGGGGDLWGGQVVESDATLSGDGESSNLLSIAQQGTTNNQVLKWDNVSNTWLPANDDVMDGDASPTNELQDLSIAGNVVSLSGSAQTITLPSNGDDWGTDVALSSSPLSGDGTLGNELSFIDGTTDGHILQWNASSSQWELNTIVNNDNDPLN